jgi:thiol-disulfide isomerase/thioredoxin
MAMKDLCMSLNVDRYGRGRALVLAVFACLSCLPESSSGQIHQPVQRPEESLLPIPPDSSDDYLIARIKRLRQLQYQETLPNFVELQMKKNLLLCDAADQLLTNFPNSPHREEALIEKLPALAELARFREEYLAKLLELTAEISKSRPSPTLGAENAYYSIEAFVLGARNERMSEEKRLAGQIERYRAFLEDYPNSNRRPMVWASLVRNLLAVNDLEAARIEAEELRKAFPGQPAAARAMGEYRRATALGKPYRFVFQSTTGEEIRSENYLGKVLVVHFWAGWRKPAVDAMPTLLRLNNQFADRGLQFIGVNVDIARDRMDKILQQYPLPWPHYFDGKGLESDAVVAAGVLGVPTYLIVDRDGILRAFDDGTNFIPEIDKWLAVPAQSATGSSGSEPPSNSTGKQPDANGQSNRP